MRRTHAYGIALAAALAGALLARPALAADPVPTARLLPPNTFVHFTIPSVDELKKRWNESAMGGIRDDRSLAEFRKDVESKLDEASERIQEHIGLSLKELLAIPSGEVAFAVVQLPGQKFGAVGFLDFGDSADEIDQLLDQAARTLEEHGAERKVEEFEGTRIVVYIKENEGGDEPSRFAYFVKDTMIVVGNEVAVLQEVLSRWDGESRETLAENEVYSYVVEQTETPDRAPVVRWFLNPIDLLRAAVMAGAQGNPQFAMVFGFLPALGLDKFKAMGGAADIATGEFESTSRTLLYIDQPAAGIINIFQFPAADLSPPRWVPATASTYFGMNWDVAGAWKAVAGLVDTFQGPGAFDQIIDALAATPDGPGIHPKRDVIDLMTGQVQVYSLPPKKTAVDDGEIQVPIEDFLVAIGIKDAQKGRGLLKKLTSIDGVGASSRQFQGETIYEFEPAGGFGQAELTFGFAVASDSLLITNNVTILEQRLRPSRGGSPLVENPEYKRVAQHFPAKTSMLSFARQETQVKAVYDMLRSGQIGGDVEGIDFSTLPPFEKMQKYLPVSGSYAVPDKRGALFVSFSLPRESK